MIRKYQPEIVHIIYTIFKIHLQLTKLIFRVYHEITGEKVDRITALDPAGIRWVDGPIFKAFPELNSNRLSPESGKTKSIDKKMSQFYATIKRSHSVIKQNAK